jgi:preprotein translocase subunit SecG
VESLIWVVHVVTAVVLVGLVLMQHGKGADMGAAFGSGSAGSLFGATGSANFLSRSTAIAATVFFMTSLALTYVYSHQTQQQGVMSKQIEVPAAPKETGSPMQNLIPGQATVAPTVPTPAQPAKQ